MVEVMMQVMDLILRRDAGDEAGDGDGWRCWMLVRVLVLA